MLTHLCCWARLAHVYANFGLIFFFCCSSLTVDAQFHLFTIIALLSLSNFYRHLFHIVPLVDCLYNHPLLQRLTNANWKPTESNICSLYKHVFTVSCMIINLLCDGKCNVLSEQRVFSTSAIPNCPPFSQVYRSKWCFVKYKVYLARRSSQIIIFSWHGFMKS